MCNHPDLFEARPIISPFDQLVRLRYHTPSLVLHALRHEREEDALDLDLFNLRLVDHETLSKIGAPLRLPVCLLRAHYR